MSESDTYQANEPGKVNLAEETDREHQLPYPVKPTKPSLLEEIKRGWKWVVFIGRMLPRLGGFTGIVRSLFLILSLLMTRLLRQWGIINNK
jgi:hypothetical protein